MSHGPRAVLEHISVRTGQLTTSASPVGLVVNHNPSLRGQGWVPQDQLVDLYSVVLTISESGTRPGLPKEVFKDPGSHTEVRISVFRNPDFLVVASAGIANSKKWPRRESRLRIDRLLGPFRPGGRLGSSGSLPKKGWADLHRFLQIPIDFYLFLRFYINFH